ncbi:MAG: MBL fold metallo-hydrolase [Actinomycetota bacterium]|nr:MBL fold metallo-hydrolase [Actinomycetota bacterium]
MFFRQVLHADLACASYVLADGGEAAVIDPKWEIEEYLELALEHGFEIEHVLETHNHADHVSGHGRLAAASGARIYVSERAGAEYEHVPLADGQQVAVGRITITALATPGHRPEHLAFVVEDGSRAGAPWLVVTGDSLFVGDLARPDLAVEPVEGARELFRSLRRLLALEDFAEVWPAHVGGSLCGGEAMSQKPASTIGFERRYNRLAAIADEGEFVRALTHELAPQPPNFERIVALNRGPLLTELAPLEPRAPARVKQLMDAGAVLVDGRDPREFDAAHVPGSINVTATKGAVGTRAAWVVDLESEVLVAGASDEEARRFGRLLEAVGFRRLGGYLAGGIAAWRDALLPVATTPAVDAAGLSERLRAGDVLLFDVREDEEWEEGHVEGSLHAPYHDLRDLVPDELRDAGKPIAVACSAGNRSSIAASLLERGGVEDVIHLVDGGVDDLAEHGIELVR